ncbi:uncharacterized protein LOC116293784 [Actinia tenebrosa]|uniref:Transcriptional protein SWT1 n=1 Tax=Actinia tenebrosa TaxID=6105 RepID=A0A6P8HWT1_ACTTE|nr:uncharacterized protein LOC116293784 [Actinia tenebrosa]
MSTNMDSKKETRPLPNGWVVRASKSRHGRSYFFNVVSGLSSWKHPSELSKEVNPKSKKKVHCRNQSGTDSSVTSGEIPAKRSKILVSPPSPSSLNTSVITVIDKTQETTKETTECIKPEKDLPKTDTSVKELEPYPDSDAESSVKVLELSAKHPQFACSRTKANHIAQWLNHVNNIYEPTEQGSVISEVTSTLKGDLDDAFSVKEIPDNTGLVDEKDEKKPPKEEKEKESPKKDVKVKENAEKPSDKLNPNQGNDTTQSNKVTQSSETINQVKPKIEQPKTRPPLKKVKPRKRTKPCGNNSNNSSTRPSISSPTKTNIFTPFGQFEQQQSEVKIEQGKITGTPMNIDRAGTNSQKFSTPFLKSPTGTGPYLQAHFSSPIGTENLRNSFSPPLENNFQNQPSFAGGFGIQSQPFNLNFEPSQEMSSEQMNENALQPDSGFDEVIDMDVDNYERLTETIKAELQEVRSDFQLDTQKIQQERTFTDFSSYGDGIYIILDTNVLLSHLKFISELKDFPIEGVGRPILVVPWIVMQELDSLKSDSWKIRQGKIVNQESKDGSVGVDSLARQAIRFLHSCFEAKHPRIRGQTLDEASEHMTAMLEESNDDRILHCCILFKRKVANGHSILFSNDQNLCSKAMVNGIRAFSHQSLIEGLKELMGSNQNRTVALQGNYFKEYYEQLSIQQQLAEKRAKADDILCELQCIMREGLSVVVEAEMRLAYDNLWDKIVYIKPPWTLQDLLIIINKHWIAVFGEVVDRKLQDTVKELTKHLDPQKAVPGCMANVAPIVDLAKTLFDGFANHSSYNGAITQCVAAIAVLQQKCKESKKDALPSLTLPPQALPSQTPALLQPEPSTPSSVRIEEVTPSNSDETASVASVSVHGEICTSTSSQPHRRVLSTFETIWSAVTQFSAQIFNALSYPNPIPPSVIENLPKPTKDEAITFLGRLCRCLGTLVSALQSVLRVPVESLNEEPQSLQKLVSAIGSFLQEILNQESPVSVEGLFHFCQDSNSRTALVQGLSQLDRALAMLQHCASCIV